MKKQAVMLQFAAMAEISLTKAMRHEALADMAIRQAESMLRPEADAEAGEETLEYLCAALCFHRYALLRGEEEESVKALDLTVTKRRGARLERAEAIRRDALTAAAGLLADSRFYFEQCAAPPCPALRFEREGRSWTAWK